MQTEQSLQRRRWPTLLSAALAVAGLSVLVFWLDPWLTHESALLTIALNITPVIVVFTLVFALCRRIWPAVLLTGLGLGLLFHINAIKLHELHQPLLLSDTLLLPQVLSNMELFALYGLDTPVLVSLAALVAALIFAFWFERPKFGLRGSVATATPVVIVLIALQTPTISAVFANQGGLDTPWSPIQSVKSSGLIAALTASTDEGLTMAPARRETQAEQLRQILSQIENTKSYSERRPDIIILLSESFFDPGIIEGVDHCEVLPRWCQLGTTSLTGSMLVPTFGGNTTRTEYEVLTGVPYNVLPDGIYPYTSIVTRQTASLASWLKSLGYQTHAIHPHSASFWQRNVAYPLMGFDEFLAEENFGPHERSGYYISDKDLTDRIAQQLSAGSNSPQFIFAVSMENHGPWTNPRPNIDTAKLASIPTPAQLSEPAALAWRQYMYHARNSTRQLERLHTLIEHREKPTLLIFFGDHLPGLHQVFKQIQFTNSDAPWAQPVPYMALSNFTLSTPEWMPERSYQLANWTLVLANLPQPRALEDLSLVYHHLANGGEHRAAIENDLQALYLEALHEDPQEWSHN